MNRYHESMEHCAPPPELEEQLREAVLSAEPEPQARTAVYRPRGFFRKALLAAVLAVVLTLSVGAAVLVDWDDIFSDRFGPEGAETPMAEKAFQPVNMTSVCDDVTLTIREALGCRRCRAGWHHVPRSLPPADESGLSPLPH